MSKKIMQELTAIKLILAKLIGTSDQPAKERFSQDALDNAARQFQKLAIERGEWIEESDISKFIKGAPYKAGVFIRTEFGFANCFKRGRSYYYSKEDLIALAKELKDRNVELRRYMEYRADEEKFRKSLQTVPVGKLGKRRKRNFNVSFDIQDIVESSPKAPPAEVIKADLERLKQEFFEYKLSDYVDIYSGNHAMMKHVYYFEKYIKPETKKRCRKWCESFNYANHAFKLVTNKTEKFIPVKEDDMITL
jgi:hypothetical protein